MKCHVPAHLSKIYCHLTSIICKFFSSEPFFTGKGGEGKEEKREEGVGEREKRKGKGRKKEGERRK